MSDSFSVMRPASGSVTGTMARSDSMIGQRPTASSRLSVAPQGPQNRSLTSTSVSAKLNAVYEFAQIGGASIEAGAFAASMVSAVLGAEQIGNAAEAAKIAGHVATAASGIATAASLIDLGRNIRADLKASAGRSDLDSALQAYDAGTSDASDASFQQARKLVEKYGPAVLDGRKDAAVARLIDIKKATLAATTTAVGTVEWAGATVAPGFGIANMALRTADSLWKVGTGASAISTLRAAVKSSNNHPVLLALAKHTETQRVAKGRIDLATAALTGAGMGLQIAAAVAGGPLALGLAGGVTGAAVAFGGVALTGKVIKEGFALNRERNAAEADFKSLVPTDRAGVEAMYRNGSLAELAALDMLRNGSTEDKNAVASFLKTFGLSDKVIFGLSVMKHDDALGLLRKKLYRDAVDTKAANKDKSAFRVFTSRLKSIGQIFYKRSEKSFSLETALKRFEPPRFALEPVARPRGSSVANNPPQQQEEVNVDFRLSVTEWINELGGDGRSSVRPTSVRLSAGAREDDERLGGASLRKRISLRFQADIAQADLRRATA